MVSNVAGDVVFSWSLLLVRMYVCMYLCMYVRMYICMCVCMYSYVCMHVCRYVLLLLLTSNVFIPSGMCYNARQDNTIQQSTIKYNQYNNIRHTE
jgi:hypothetical protein